MEIEVTYKESVKNNATMVRHTGFSAPQKTKLVKTHENN